MSREENEYPPATCMDCGALCDRWEEVDIGNGGPYELWCYCTRCAIDTFHPPVKKTRITEKVAKESL